MSDNVNKDENTEPKPKHQDKIVALDSLSLGISIVAAIIIGFGVGYGLKQLTGYTWALWVGIAWGIAEGKRLAPSEESGNPVINLPDSTPFTSKRSVASGALRPPCKTSRTRTPSNEPAFRRDWTPSFTAAEWLKQSSPHTAVSARLSTSPSPTHSTVRASLTYAALPGRNRTRRQ